MVKKINTLCIANRGEIAVRLISLCEEMNIKPVLLYSEADKNSKAFRLCSHKICIGAAQPNKSYLNIPAVIKGAVSCGADALHPGYGFLSENPELAKACYNKNIIFIGPPINCLEIFGDKVRSRKQAIKCGIPVLPAAAASLKDAIKIGFPVIIKSLHGGGGRGLRIVTSKKQWSEALLSAQRETKSAFGSSKLFIEKYLSSAQHIEVQIFADSLGRVSYLLDRDCSIQKKHQKIIEVAPSNLPLGIKKQMQNASVELVKSVGYVQAGTVEFLYGEGKFYFMEVNPRIQVECPVTEMILGIDLIRAQILTAQGLKPFIQQKFTPRGYSIECRIYAENMQKQLPVFGTLGACEFPTGVNWRFDMGYESGDTVSKYYDAMLGKLIAWEESRDKALDKITQALNKTVIFGLKTNISFLQDLIKNPDFRKQNIYTRFIEETFLKSWKEADINSVDSKVLSVLQKHFSSGAQNISYLEEENTFNPWKYFS